MIELSSPKKMLYDVTVAKYNKKHISSNVCLLLRPKRCVPSNHQSSNTACDNLQTQPDETFSSGEYMHVLDRMLLIYFNLECRCPGWAKIMNMQWL